MYPKQNKSLKYTDQELERGFWIVSSITCQHLSEAAMIFFFFPQVFCSDCMGTSLHYLVGYFMLGGVGETHDLRCFQGGSFCGLLKHELVPWPGREHMVVNTELRNLEHY